MPDLDAKVSTQYEFGGTITSADGKRTLKFLADDSFSSWWAIARWNFHFGHWRALGMNARDLFTKVIRRKLWRR